MKANWTNALKLAQKTYHLMCVQERAGFQFDTDRAVALTVRIKEEMLKIEETVEPQLPPRPLKQAEVKDFTMPAKPFKKDGTFSSNMVKFMEKHSGYFIDPMTVEFYGLPYTVKGSAQLSITRPMKLSNQEDIKEWLLTQGWKPTLWNYKKDARGKPVRDEFNRLIKTTPKLQDKGKICSDLIKRGELGNLVGVVVRWLSLRNRHSVVEGWLANPRLKRDGRLPAGATGITNTNRQKHTIVVNVPKAEESVLLGREMRQLFIARPGLYLVGADAKALEARIEAHYTYRYDNGAYAKDLLEGDVHNKNTQIFFPRETGSFNIYDPNFNKDDPNFKPYRSRSKNGKYALSYGCTAKKLAETLGCSPSEGETLYENFWNSNYSLKALRDNLTRFWETNGQKRWIIGLDGRKLFTRSKHSLVNTLFQSAGAICMDFAGAYVARELDKDLNLKSSICRVGYFHDEYNFETDIRFADYIGELTCTAIKKAGEFFKLNVPLDGEYKIGKNWAEIH